MTTPPGECRSPILMLETVAADLLTEAGIAYPAHRLALSADEAVAAAEELGFPVVVKVVSPDVVHKSDVGAVATGLRDAAAVREAVAHVRDSTRRALPHAAIVGYLVCEQVDGGHEVIIGALRDRTFGPAVMFGFGGVYAEVFGDVTFRVAPLAPSDARAMLSETTAFPMLSGARGAERADLNSLDDMLMKVSQLVVRRPDIMELDLNPVRAKHNAAIALDARIVVAPHEVESGAADAGAGPLPDGESHERA